MKKYVVTGGAGFIGSALVRGLLALGDGRVEVIDNLLTGKRGNLDGVDGPVPLHQVDIRSYDDIAPVLEGADTVYHLAAIPSVPKSIDQPVPSHEVNIDGTFNVMRAAAAGGVRKLVYAASSSAYGDTPVLPKVEAMSPNPRSPYAAQKLMGEYYRRLAKGEGRAQALRSAQQAMQSSAATAHPYYWAAFVPIGDWRAVLAK